MKRVFLVAAVLLASAGSALADPYANYYGNTVSITGSDGTKVATYVNADMTWEQHVGSMATKGTYAWKDATTACFTQTDPTPKSPDQATVCFQNQSAHNVGDSWTVTGGDGKPIAITLVAGR
jgi:hypothetical protein